jgi:hypothetical protein
MLAWLAAAVEEGEFGPAPLHAWAVTPRLREWYAGSDIEELEYAAALEAARGSLRLLAAAAAGPLRRVVVAADVPEAGVCADATGTRAAVTLSLPVALRWVASVQVDDLETAGDVRAAARALPAADAGDEDAIFVVDGAEAHDLLWYATQEIPEL